MAGNADLLNQEFERSLKERVIAAVETDPALESRYQAIRAGWLVETGIKCLSGLLLIPVIWGAWSVTTVHGKLSPAILMSVNIAGTFLPLCMLAGIWRMLTGPDVMAALPRMPISDQRNFTRAWKLHSIWAWRGAFVFWLLIYAAMVWYGEIWAQAWVWMPLFAAIQACFSLALCSLVSLLNHLLKEQLVSMHLLWLLVTLGASIMATMEGDLMRHHRQLVDQVNHFLPTRFGASGLIAVVNGYLPDLAPFGWLLLGSAVAHWISGQIHRRVHPLARLGRRGNVYTKVNEQRGNSVEGWCLSDEHGAFWSKRGPIEKALWGLTTRRERLALEGIANACLDLTRQWGRSLAIVAMCMFTAWVMHLYRSNWTVIPILFAVMTAVGFVILPPVLSRQRFGGNMTVMQNPFPFLPVSARDLYFALIKATIVKAGFAITHVVLFVGYLGLTRGGFHWKRLGYHGETIVVVWIVAAGIGAFVAIAPILAQSNVISIRRIQGWISILAYLFIIAGPFVAIGIFVNAGVNGWLFVLAPVIILFGSAHLTFWMWREGTYDFTGIPLISKGVEQVGPSNYSTAKSID